MTDLKLNVNKFVLFCSVVLLLQTAVSADNLQLLSGKNLRGKVSFSKGIFVCDSQNVPADQVLLFTTEQSVGGGSGESRVFLDGGDVFAANLQSGSLREILTLLRPDGQRLEFTISQVLAVQISPFSSGAVVDASVSGSQIQMTNGKAISCEIDWITPQEVGIKTAAGSLRLQRELVARLVFNNSAQSNTADAVADGWKCRVISRTGDDFSAVLTAMDGKSIQAKAVCGVVTLPIEDIFCLLLRSDKLLPLTKLKPASVKVTPYIDFVRQPRINQGLLGGALLCCGMQWRSGLATHSKTEISYTLNKAYSLFSCFVGVNKISDAAVKATAIVQADNKDVARIELEAGQPMRYLAVNMSGVQDMKIIFDYGPDGSRGDHGVWGLPLLVKGSFKAAKPAAGGNK